MSAEAREGDSAPAELYDRDGMSGIIALRIDGPESTRGRAAAIFAREWDLDFTEVRVRRTAFRPDHEHAEECAADGIKEPYDGWPLVECESNERDAALYWALREECYDR